MNNTITANELKTKGISLIDKVTKHKEEAILTFRGKSEYVILPIEMYNKFREFELENALKESRENIEQGKFVKETVDEHIKRIASIRLFILNLILKKQKNL
jgi:PHD/YefM family antitoxin component YafN of YafNO toxin-antitoxin module